jgi:NTE family protein
MSVTSPDSNEIAERAAAERSAQLTLHLASLFPGLDRDGLDAFAAGVNWVALRGGEVLFHEGDPGDAAYLLISGRTRAVAAVGDGERMLSEMGAGETIGEMALLSDAVRSATVYALRDCQLARLSRDTFDSLVERHPLALRRIAGFVVERLRRHTSGAAAAASPLVSLAIVPARPGPDLDRLIADLEAELRRFGTTERIDRSAVERALGPGAADARDHESAGVRLVRWLNERDRASRYVVYAADPTWTPWTERALRQADHVLVVARAEDGPELGDSEERLAEIWRKTRAPRRSLVLLHAPDEPPQGTSAWLARRDVERHFHVHAGSRGDVARLVRLLTGHAVGLVLGGGGARGFAHLGALRALEEAGVPIDAIGGTSMGAIVGALPAMGFDASTSHEMCRQYVGSLFDPTLPLVSLLSGRRIGSRLAEALGSGDIEDLPIPFFCVSTNLSRAGAVIHRRGPLFRAVRSSISLPGILPPITVDGDLYVDGGLIDNLPIETMAEQHGGSVIAIDVSPEQDLRSEFDLAAGFSGWRVLWRRLNPFAAPLDVPYISSVLMRSVVVASLARERERRAAETASLYLKMPVDDWRLLDFDRLDAIAARGYEASAAAIGAWWQRQRATTASC